MAARSYPVRVDASLDTPLSRWLWLVKWLLLIPHYIVLMFLWVAFAALSVAAFFVILFAGRYPREIFEFNVGVLRWTWRVQYYAAGAFGTDRYPPFTLAEDPSYPAHLEIDHPSRLSRGLVLVKWWLLAIPHYIVVGLFTGGGAWLAWRAGADNVNWGGWGLIGVLAVIAAVVLLVTGRYPEQIFDFVLGLNRWVLRVAAYAGLMTDSYPPFRLDMGGRDPGSVTLSRPPPPSGQAPLGEAAPGQGPPGGGPAGHLPPRKARRGWSGGRVVSVVAGAVLGLLSLGMLGAGGTALAADAGAGPDGYVHLGTVSYSTPGYAVASDDIELNTAGGGWDAARALVGDVRIRAVSPIGDPVFIGVAPAGAASRYLSGVAHATVHGGPGAAPRQDEHAGSAPATPPERSAIWVSQAAGPGPQSVVWPARSGNWTVVAMNADGSRPVSVRADVAATLPALPWIGVGLTAGGALVLAGGVLLIVVPVRRASGRGARRRA